MQLAFHLNYLNFLENPDLFDLKESTPYITYEIRKIRKVYLLKGTDFMVIVTYEPDSNCIHIIRWTNYLIKSPYFGYSRIDPKDVFENSPENVREKLVYYLDILSERNI